MTGATTHGQAVSLNRSTVTRRFVGDLTREQAYRLRQAGAYQLRASGLTFRQIAQYFGVTEGAVRSWMKNTQELATYVDEDETTDGIRSEVRPSTAHR